MDCGSEDNFGIPLHLQYQHLRVIYRKNKLICAENTKFKKLRQKFKQITYLKIVVVLQNKTTVAVLENM